MAEAEHSMSGDEAARLVAKRARALAQADAPPTLIGINGAQGSGKSTMAHAVADLLEREHGLTCAILSLDDFYLTRAARAELATRVHPLCATRGVPGTHDVPLLRQTLAALGTACLGSKTPVPRFDKLADDREPRERWRMIHGRRRCVLLEGWCVGVMGADLPHWTGPINPLEAGHDPDGRWFAWSLSALGDYEPIWNFMDLLVSIEVPDLETVIDSRLEQERGLTSQSGRLAMDRAAVSRFVQHYERYTRALWTAMRTRADLLLRRNRDFRFTLDG